MPRTKLDAMRPNPRAVAKLIEYYMKIDSNLNVLDTMSKASVSKNVYYSRMKEPEKFTLEELRKLAKTLKIPQEELTIAFEEAIKY